MNITPLISVIVPVYNVREYLERCIYSIINQTHNNLQIILIDDGSTDGSGHICDEFMRKDSRILSIHQSNAGQSAARNTGLNLVKGDFVAFIDSDDYWDSDMLEYLLSVMTAYECDISVCSVRHVGFPGIDENENTLEKINIFTSYEAVKDTLLGANGLSGSACHALFRAKVIKNMTFMEGHLYEDLEFMVRAMLNANKVAASNTRKYNYCYRENNSSSTPTYRRKKDLDVVIQQIKNTITNSCPELIPMAEQRYISNSMYLARSLHNGEKYMLSMIRKDLLKFKPEKKALSKSDWILSNALLKGERVFNVVNKLYTVYRKLR